jgi:hypothetical protein
VLVDVELEIGRVIEFVNRLIVVVELKAEIPVDVTDETEDEKGAVVDIIVLK